MSVIAPKFKLSEFVKSLLKGEKLGNMPSVYWSLNYWPVEADR